MWRVRACVRRSWELELAAPWCGCGDAVSGMAVTGVRALWLRLLAAAVTIASARVLAHDDHKTDPRYYPKPTRNHLNPRAAAIPTLAERYQGLNDWPEKRHRANLPARAPHWHARNTRRVDRHMAELVNNREVRHGETA